MKKTHVLDIHVFSNPLSIHDALAIENLLFDEYVSSHTNTERTHTTKDVVLFWKSQKSAVIGRNQNPWKECDCSFLFSNDIILARRDSGGGAVFHDEGNLNISIVSQIPEKNENRIHANLRILTQALKTSHNIHARIGKHNDVFVHEKKITGSAMRVVKKSLLHHFTLLLNTDLTVLRKALYPIDTFEIETKSVPSRPHSVANIHCAANLIIDAYIHQCEKVLKTKAHVKMYKSISQEFYAKEHFADTRKRISSNTWVFNRTPLFSVHIPIHDVNYTAVFSNGMLCELKYNFQSIRPYTKIYMSPSSLYTASENRQENTLIRRIVKILHNCYYKNVCIEIE